MSYLIKSLNQLLQEIFIIILKKTGKNQGSGGGGGFERINYNLLPIKRNQLIKKEQDNGYTIKEKLRKSNDNWNYWRLQFHWVKLE